MGNIWGINRKVALWTYKTILLSKLLYTSVICWPMVIRVEVKNLPKGKYSYKATNVCKR